MVAHSLFRSVLKPPMAVRAVGASVRAATSALVSTTRPDRPAKIQPPRARRARVRDRVRCTRFAPASRFGSLISTTGRGRRR